MHFLASLLDEGVKEERGYMKKRRTGGKGGVRGVPAGSGLD